VVMAKTATMSDARLFWGHPAQVRTARRFVVASLAGYPVAVDRDVVALLVSELVTNAVVHSASGRADGTLLVGYQLARDGPDSKRLRLRVEVRDLGGPGHPRRCWHALESIGRRGLEVVEALASRWGVGRHPRGRVVWFELELALLDRGGGAWSDRAAVTGSVGALLSHLKIAGRA
jgi:anti-sigma regulatory factor (Ser/Thr protein kinase)